MISRCEKDYGQGNCESLAAVVYPKCRPGYRALGCCMCESNNIDCQAYDMDETNVDSLCKKKIVEKRNG